MKKEIIYTPTEVLLMDKIPYLDEISDFEIESLANDIDRGLDVYAAIELGRHPSTDERTYTLHVQYSKPTFDYYGFELYNLENLGI